MAKMRTTLGTGTPRSRCRSPRTGGQSSLLPQEATPASAGPVGLLMFSDHGYTLYFCLEVMSSSCLT